MVSCLRSIRDPCDLPYVDPHVTESNFLHSGMPVWSSDWLWRDESVILAFGFAGQLY